jgi:hypothetical protein
MSDDRDPLLTRLFAEQSPPGHESDFMARSLALLERDRRNRHACRMGMTITSVVVAVLLAPWIAQVAATAVGLMAANIAATRSLLTFSMSWLLLCSIVATFIPVLYLGITRRW